MTTFEAKMKLDAADVNYRARLAAINDVHKVKKEQISLISGIHHLYLEISHIWNIIYATNETFCRK